VEKSRAGPASRKVGEDTGKSVSLSYDVPFKFTGNFANVKIELRRFGAA
jgi:hypothetical protein